jgi:peptide chain release factor subunit 1
VPIANPSSSSRRPADHRGRGRQERSGAGTGTLAPDIARLMALGPTPHWVVSCYLKLEPRDRGRGKYLIKLKNRSKRLLAGLEARGVGRTERTAVERDLERIRAHLAQPSSLPAGRGIAVFACEPLRVFVAVPLPLVFRSRLVVDHSPLVRELAALDDEFGRVVCVVYDRTGARFFEVTAHGVAETLGLTAGETTRAGRFHAQTQARTRGGLGMSAFGEHNFNQRIRVEKQRHYAQIAQRLFELTREGRVRGVVLGGTGTDVAAAEAHLHPYMGDLVLGTAKLNPKTASAADVLRAVLEVRREREREWERRHVAELTEALGTGWGVNGIDAALGALAHGQVRTLLVDPAVERSGYRCAGTGRLALSADDCGPEGAAEPVPDVIDEAIEEALRQGTHVDVVEDPSVRSTVDGLAALLRFKRG